MVLLVCRGLRIFSALSLGSVIRVFRDSKIPFALMLPWRFSRNSECLPLQSTAIFHKHVPRFVFSLPVSFGGG